MILDWAPADCVLNRDARGEDIRVGDWILLGAMCWGKVKEIWHSDNGYSTRYKAWWVRVEGVYYNISLSDELYTIARRDG